MSRRSRHKAKAGFFWLVPAAFGVHIAEELPRFPQWATRHFGTTTKEFYVASHCLLGPAVIACCAAAAKGSGGWKGPFAGAAAASVMVANTIYHLGTTALFREYSPGAATAVLGMLPASVYALRRARAEGLLTDEQLLGAVLVGNASCLAAVGSLYVDMPTLGGVIRQ
ncbi:MAG TPA: HXXEE domain-containing protein [Thermoleophilaceae bacterium]